MYNIGVLTYKNNYHFKTWDNTTEKTSIIHYAVWPLNILYNHVGFDQTKNWKSEDYQIISNKLIFRKKCDGLTDRLIDKVVTICNTSLLPFRKHKNLILRSSQVSFVMDGSKMEKWFLNVAATLLQANKKCKIEYINFDELNYMQRLKYMSNN